jgi:hypothetical protein
MQARAGPSDFAVGAVCDLVFHTSEEIKKFSRSELEIHVTVKWASAGQKVFNAKTINFQPRV